VLHCRYGNFNSSLEPRRNCFEIIGGATEFW
jgi:hypothetical protein